MFLLLLLLAPPLQADSAAGAKVYSANCTVCHGVDGRGKGPAAAALQPPPPDFTSPDFWKHHQRSQLAQAVQHGVPGSSMVAFPNLSAAQIQAVLDYLESLGK